MIQFEEAYNILPPRWRLNFFNYLAHRLALAARLRNLLVHRYWAISDVRVYESVREGLNDFESYIRYVRLLLEGG